MSFSRIGFAAACALLSLSAKAASFEALRAGAFVEFTGEIEAKMYDVRDGLMVDSGVDTVPIGTQAIVTDQTFFDLFVSMDYPIGTYTVHLTKINCLRLCSIQISKDVFFATFRDAPEFSALTLLRDR